MLAEPVMLRYFDRVRGVCGLSLRGWLQRAGTEAEEPAARKPMEGRRARRIRALRVQLPKQRLADGLLPGRDCRRFRPTAPVAPFRFQLRDRFPQPFAVDIFQ